MALARPSDHGDRGITQVVDGGWFVDEVVVKELSCYMVGFGHVVGDISSFEG